MMNMSCMGSHYRWVLPIKRRQTWDKKNYLLVKLHTVWFTSQIFTDIENTRFIIYRNNNNNSCYETMVHLVWPHIQMTSLVHKPNVWAGRNPLITVVTLISCLSRIVIFAINCKSAYHMYSKEGQLSLVSSPQRWEVQCLACASNSYNLLSCYC